MITSPFWPSFPKFSAGQNWRPRRRRRRPARSARGRGRRGRHPRSRLSAVMKAIERAETAIAPYESFGGHARVLRATPAASISSCWTRRIFLRARRPYTAPDGTDWPDNPLRSRPSPRPAQSFPSAARRGFRPISCMRMTGSGLTAAYLEHDPRPRPGTVITIHNLAFQGQYPASCLAPSVCRMRLSRSTALNITA